jgi:hypothetical protein
MTTFVNSPIPNLIIRSELTKVWAAALTLRQANLITVEQFRSIRVHVFDSVRWWMDYAVASGWPLGSPEMEEMNGLWLATRPL